MKQFRQLAGAAAIAAVAFATPAAGADRLKMTVGQRGNWDTAVRHLGDKAGIRRFDACTGGIGGCPHAPGASGNVATEDLAYLFASMGVPTGLDFKALIALRGQIAQWLDGEPLYGAIWRAGLPRTFA